jgi:hypothetical protein
MATILVNRVPPPYGIDFGASALQMTLLASAVPASNRNALHVIAPLTGPALSVIREAALPGKMTKDNWIATIAPGAVGVLGAAILGFMQYGSKRK